MKYLFIALIRLYKLTISRLKPPCCRFYPSCSSYGIEAIRRFGAVKGGCLTLKRIARCNPFSAGGSDPVPEEYYFFRKRAGRAAVTEKEKITADS